MRRFNLNQFIWVILLGILIGSIGFLLISDKLFSLIVGSMKIYVVLTLIFLTLIFLIEIKDIFTVPSRGGIKKGYIFFILLIATLVIVSNTDILRNSLIMKGVVIEHKGHNHNKNHNHKLSFERDNILINKENFHSSVEAILENTEDYKTMPITVEGLLYNEKVEVGDFFITQVDMNCCMADSKFLGITCVGSINSEFKTGDYVRVKGTLNVTEYKGEKIPVIYINQLENFNN